MLLLDNSNQRAVVPGRRANKRAQAKTIKSSNKPLTYRHTIEIYLKDSNAYTNTYFSRYFEWQGVCRERWFHECITADMLQPLGVLITKHADTDYLRETFPFQKVECQLNTYNVKKCSFFLLFRFSVAGEPVAVGRQQIVFANHDKEISAFPKAIIDKVKRYEIPAPR